MLADACLVVVGLGGQWLLAFVVASTMIVGTGVLFDDAYCGKVAVVAALILGASNGAVFASIGSTVFFSDFAPWVRFTVFATMITLGPSAVLVAGRRYLNRQLVHACAFATTVGFVIPQALSLLR